MDSATIVEKYGAKLEGQQMLYPDPDYVLRKTKFRPIDPEFDKQALVHWWMNVYLPDQYVDEYSAALGGINQEVYRSWSNAIYSYFSCARCSGSYNSNTSQSTVQFQAYKHDLLDPQIAELKMWLPHIKPCLNPESKREGRHISILERKLSKDGAWRLWIYSDNDLVLTITAYHRYSEVEKFTDLVSAVKYIAENVWYQKSYGNYDDYDE